MCKPRVFTFLLTFLITILFPICLKANELPSFQRYQGPLKPGMVITRENFSTYLPELKKLLPPAKLQWYSGGITKGIVTIPIVKTTYHPLTKGQLEATRKYGGTAMVGDNNQLLKWIAGVPFPEPKSAIEIAWNCYPTVSRTTQHDEILIDNWFGQFKETRYEKHFLMTMIGKKYHGRVDIPPLGELPAYTENGITCKESNVVTEPHEVKGFIQLRIRYWDVDKPDKCYAYIPAIRRIRRLTGIDTADPILGSDAVFDDFEVWRQKLDDKMKFRVLGYRDFLLPRTYIGRENKPHYDYKKHGPYFQVEWEIRPHLVLEITLNNPNHVYSKRIIYIDGVPLDQGGTYLLYWGEQYDRKGRLWRANGQGAPSDNSKGFKNMYNWVYMNALTSHYTVMDVTPAYELGEEKFSKTFPLDEDKEFTIKGLLRRAR